ncbi:MAG: hypothetical protein P8X57_11690 [Cyclobacteriaceae bacterium]
MKLPAALEKLNKSYIRSLLAISAISLVIAWLTGEHQFSQQVYGKYYHLGWRIFFPVFFLLTGLIFLVRQITVGFHNRVANIILISSWILLVTWFLQLIWQDNGPTL